MESNTVTAIAKCRALVNVNAFRVGQIVFIIAGRFVFRAGKYVGSLIF